VLHLPAVRIDATDARTVEEEDGLGRRAGLEGSLPPRFSI